MDKETLRKQLFEEIHSQFETKLREAKRQKSQVEEELESSSEKWRSERRRLNAEIDRLESALSEVKDSRKKTAESKKTLGVDTQELAKVRAAAEEKLKAAAREWDSERTRLETEIARLQRGVAELIERSNNPLRASQSVKDDLEVKINEALRMKKEVEDEFINAKAAWEKEKLRMAGEMVKLRRTTPGRAGTVKFAEEDRYEEMQKRLEVATKRKESSEREIEKASSVASAEQQKLNSALSALRKELEELRRQSQSNETGLTEQLRDVLQQRSSLQQAVDQGSRTIQSTSARVAELESGLAKVSQNRDGLERDLEKTQGQVSRLQEELDQTKRQAKSAADGTGQQIQDTLQLKDSLEKQIEEAGKRRVNLEHALEKARNDASAEQQKLVAELSQVREELKQTQRQSGSTAAETAQQLRKVLQENASLQKQLEEIRKGREGLEHSLDKAKSAASAEQRKFEAELSQLGGELKRAMRQIESTTAGADAQGRETLQQKELAQKQIEELSRVRQNLESDLEKTKHDLSTEQQKSSAEVSQLREELQQAKRQIASTAAGADAQLREALHQKDSLQKQLEELSRVRQTLESDLEKAKRDASTGQKKSTVEVSQLQEELKQAKRQVESTAAGADAQLREALHQKDSLQRQFEELSRVRQSLESDLEKTKSAASAGQQKSNAEVSQLREELQQSKRQIESHTAGADTQLRKALHQTDSLQKQFEELSRVRQTLEHDFEKVKSEAAAEREKLDAEVSKLREELKQARIQGHSDTSGGEQLRDAMQQKNFLQLQVGQANEAVQSIRAEQAEERKKVTAELESSRTKIQHLERKLAEHQGSVNTEVVEQLRKQYEERMQVMIQQKTVLTEELKEASSLLDSERHRLAAANSEPTSDKSGQVDTGAMDVEVTRISALIADISKFIDDPSTDFSAAIRKNVERAQLDAYVKGILFSTGRGKGM